RRHTRSTRDWSSDVCSSDLGISSGGKNGNAISAHPTTAIQKSGEDFTSTGERERTIRKATTSIKLNKTIAAPDAYGEAWNSGTQIGRASCRERVENTVVDTR